MYIYEQSLDMSKLNDGPISSSEHNQEAATSMKLEKQKEKTVTNIESREWRKAKEKFSKQHLRVKCKCQGSCKVSFGFA